MDVHWEHCRISRTSRPKFVFGRLYQFGIACALVLLTLHPVQRPDFWWHAARGREVCVLHTMQPSSALLAAEESAEADWLGGLYPYLAHSAFGVHGLMAFRVLTGLLIGLSLIQRRTVPPHVLRDSVAIIAVGAASCDLDPGPIAAELILGTLVFRSCQTWFSKVDRRCPVLPLLATLVWANVGPHPQFACVAALMAYGTRQTESSRRGRLFALMLSLGFAMCCTPRWHMTHWDAIRLTCPAFFASSWHLMNTSLGALNPERDLIRLAAILLILLAFLYVHRQSDSRRWCLLTVIIAMIPAVVCRSVFPVALLLLSFGVVGHPKLARYRSAVPQPRSRIACWTPLLIALAIGSARVVENDAYRPGWGLVATLQPQLPARTLQHVAGPGTVYGVDTQSAGLAAWILNKRMPVVDVDERAFLGGRLHQKRRIEADLAAGRRDFYFRSDGSTGGWWRELERQNVRLIMTSRHDDQIIDALMPTFWKPLAIDTAIAVLGRVDNTSLRPAIMRTIAHADAINHEPWSYVPGELRYGDVDFDVLEFLTGEARVGASLNLASRFRSMRLYTAALRVLHPLLRRHPNNAAIQFELLRSQVELAAREKVDAGTCSDIRVAILEQLERLGTSKTVRLEAQRCLDVLHGDAIEQDARAHPDVATVVQSYLAGDAVRDHNSLEAPSDESLYARAVAAYEAGDSVRARDIQQQLEECCPESDRTRNMRLMFDAIPFN